MFAAFHIFKIWVPFLINIRQRSCHILWALVLLWWCYFLVSIFSIPNHCIFYATISSNFRVFSEDSCLYRYPKMFYLWFPIAFSNIQSSIKVFDSFLNWCLSRVTNADLVLLFFMWTFCFPAPFPNKVTFQYIFF